MFNKFKNSYFEYLPGRFKIIACVCYWLHLQYNLIIIINPLQNPNQPTWIFIFFFSLPIFFFIFVYSSKKNRSLYIYKCIIANHRSNQSAHFGVCLEYFFLYYILVLDALLFSRWFNIGPRACDCTIYYLLLHTHTLTRTNPIYANTIRQTDMYCELRIYGAALANFGHIANIITHTFFSACVCVPRLCGWARCVCVWFVCVCVNYRRSERMSAHMCKVEIVYTKFRW